MVESTEQGIKIFGMTPKLLLGYITLGFVHPVMISFVYMQYVYYDAMIGVMGITNAQLGLLLTIDGIGAMLLALPGGILSDKFNCKFVMFVSLMISGIACAAFALSPTYPTAIVVWIVLSITMCGFYGAVYKVVRIIAPPELVGRSFGIFGFCNAIGFMVLNFVTLHVYSSVEASSGMHSALSAVLWIFVAVYFVGGIVNYLVLRTIPDPTGETDDDGEGFKLSDVLLALKNPGTYLVFIVGFVINSLHITISYFTPYFTSVLGVALVISGAIAVIRQYGLRLVAAPAGGVLGDKIQSTTKVLAGGLVITAVLIAIVMGMPPSVALVVAIILVFTIAFFDNMLISLAYSILGEAGIPRTLHGTVMGIITIIIPDLFVPTMFGSWLDNFGNAGYTYIFGFTIVLNIVGVLACIAIVRRSRKREAEGGEAHVV